jgi:hypothetical protein
MGQYHYIVNLTKKQFIHPHRIGSGLKLTEQIGWDASPSTALFLLVACSNGRGGGDVTHHPLVGHWAGDRIAIIGDYAQEGDIASDDYAGPNAAAVLNVILSDDPLVVMAEGWKDISPAVREMMGLALGAKYALKTHQQGRATSLDDAGWIDVQIS